MKCWVCDKEDFHSLAEYNPERELLVCKGCGAITYKDRMPSCVDWCKYAESCVGPDLYRKLKLS